MYSKGKPRGITLNIIQKRTSLVSFFEKFFLMMYSRLTKNSAVNRNLNDVTNNWNKIFMN